MLTRLIVRNFKRFREIDIELSERVVFVGPNNSGKTTALQALSLWQLGLRKWGEKRSGEASSRNRVGVAINRKDLIASPHSATKLLWRRGRTRRTSSDQVKREAANVRIDIVVEGVAHGKSWKCGFEFDYANEESFYCRPLRGEGADSECRMPVPSIAAETDIVFLPPLTGLVATERRHYPGAINAMIGEGRTAEVLRNICFRVAEERPEEWRLLAMRIDELFGAKLEAPKWNRETGEISIHYNEQGFSLDLSSSGSGLQQTLLILAYMYSNPGGVLLLDEPDAHLEILRQRQIYGVIGEVARESGSQIIVASHSEVLLNEAAENDTVIAFVGAPHRIGNRWDQIRKSLAEVPYNHYLLAEQTGWVLYLEGPTDLAILQAFAKRLEHADAVKALERPFAHYVGNQPRNARSHYYAIREAVPRLKGVALFDRLERSSASDTDPDYLEWSKREIESYLLNRNTLIGFARSTPIDPSPGVLFDEALSNARVKAMENAIATVEQGLEALNKGDPWGVDVKASDEVLVPIFVNYYKTLGSINLMRKSNFHVLVDSMQDDGIDPEIREKLDKIAEVASHAEPVSSDV